MAIFKVYISGIVLLLLIAMCRILDAIFDLIDEINRSSNHNGYNSYYNVGKGTNWSIGILIVSGMWTAFILLSIIILGKPKNENNANYNNTTTNVNNTRY